MSDIMLYIYHLLLTAVGKKIRIKDSKNDQKDIVIKERPMQCALCPIKSEIHAMHPLYDKHHKDGQPLVKSDDTPIWVHTVCAIFVCSNVPTVNLIYGCDEDGMFDFDSQDEDDSKESISADQRNYSFFKYYDNDEEVLTAMPHHFVITSKAGCATDLEMRTLTESRELRCYVCDNPDMRSRRIPVQVSQLSFD